MRQLDSKGMLPECYTIREFCAAHRIGVTAYAQLRAQGRGPKEFRLGKRVLITKEAAARWRADRDAETQQNQEAS